MLAIGVERQISQEGCGLARSESGKSLLAHKNAKAAEQLDTAGFGHIRINLRVTSWMDGSADERGDLFRASLAVCCTHCGHLIRRLRQHACCAGTSPTLRLSLTVGTKPTNRWPNEFCC